MTDKKIAQEKIKDFVDELIKKGKRVIGPKKSGDLILFMPLKSSDEMTFEYLNSNKSVKEFMFPSTEAVLKFDSRNKDVEVQDEEIDTQDTVIIGVRPCDAASFPVLDSVFKWDYMDDTYLKRRNATTIISISCDNPDDCCFCTSVGLAPDSTQGSDILLTKVVDGSYYAEAVSPKGEELIKQNINFFDDGGKREDRNEAGEKVKKSFIKNVNTAGIKSWLDAHFDDELWDRLALKCLGCGTCTYLCPTCHCFDIVDEAQFYKGERRKNWDSCQFGHFTVHASGHNPRENQLKRYRQRIMHKFKYYIDKFGMTLCTGCGRCVRACPVNLDIEAVLEEIAVTAQKV